VKVVVTFTLGLAIGSAAAGSYTAYRFDRRLAAIERTIPALEREKSPAPNLAAPKQPAARRTPQSDSRGFRASNGVYLTPDEVSRLDERGREMDRHAAELEYSLIGRDRERSGQSRAPASQPANVNAPQP
jgi:hypothetical protein